MWTTTLTSVAAMVPLIALAPDSDFWLGLALVVTGGLVSSTLFGPLVTAALVAAAPRNLNQNGVATVPLSRRTVAKLRSIRQH